MSSYAKKHGVPRYIEDAILRLSEDHDLALAVVRLMPELGFRAGVSLTNAVDELRAATIRKLQEEERRGNL